MGNLQEAITPVNKRMAGGVQWVAIFGERKAVLWGKTEKQAIQAAHEHFKPKKGERDLVAVALI